MPRPGSQIYPARVAALAVAGDRASAATALLVNFPVFGEAMARVRQALLQHYGFKREQIGFVTAFAEPPPASFEAAALAEISLGTAGLTTAAHGGQAPVISPLTRGCPAPSRHGAWCQR